MPPFIIQKKKPKDPNLQKFIVTVYIYSGGGYNDPAESTPLPPIEMSLRIGPGPFFSESDIDKITRNIGLNGYTLVDEESETRTTYPPGRISHITAIPEED